ncbi:MAG: hypothetical protein H3C52_00775, partial [Anaerolineales bacterium]|nr:hypothetical protein [Anaerolineales bacterium]
MNLPSQIRKIWTRTNADERGLFSFRLLPSASRLLPPASRLLPPASRLLPPASRL